MEAPETRERLVIRPAQSEDAAALREIFNEGVQDGLATFSAQPRSLDDERQRLAEAARNSRHAIRVGQLGRWVLGWVAIEPCDARPALEGVGELTVFVRRSFRKHGVGKQLMQAAQQEAPRSEERRVGKECRL